MNPYDGPMVEDLRTEAPLQYKRWSAIPYWPRWVNAVFAFFASYYWLPCPVCSTKFGGHENDPGSVTVNLGGARYFSVCPRCSQGLMRIDGRRIAWPLVEARRVLGRP